MPATWPRLEILHLSDLHLRTGAPALFRAQARLLASLPRQPDIVCVTGDLCETGRDAHLVPRLLGNLRPPHGVFLILGNHEYGARPNPIMLGGFGGLLWKTLSKLFGSALSTGPEEGEAIIAVLQAAGLEVLRNDGRRIETKGRSVWIAGSDSVWAARSDPDRAARGRQPGEGLLALIHEPEAAFAAAESGAEVILAGHTHGGQVRLPWIGAVYSHRADPRIGISAGQQMVGSAWLHVSAGFGQLLPLRFFCPPEITWITCEPNP